MDGDRARALTGRDDCFMYAAPIHPAAAKARQRSRMNIQNSGAITPQDAGAELAQISRQHNQLGAMRHERPSDNSIEIRFGTELGLAQVIRGDFEYPRMGKSWGVPIVANNHASAGVPRFHRDRLEDRFHTASAVRSEEANF